MTYTSKRFESESAEPALHFFNTISLSHEDYRHRRTSHEILKLKEVIEKNCIKSFSAIYRKMDEGDFPYR